MAEKGITEVSPDLRELYRKGAAALQRNNLDYAIAIFEQVLQKDPAFFECRQALRATQFKKAGSGTSFFKRMLGGASASPLLAKAQMSLRKNPLETIVVAEQILSKEPSNSPAHKLLAEAAMASGLPRTACLSLEIALKHSPKDYDLTMEYGRALAAAGQVAKAEIILGELFKLYPTRAELAQTLKDLSASKTMTEGGYDALADGSGSYRDILKDKHEAESLEQENRQARSEDNIQGLIKEYETRLIREPKNLKLIRSLAELYTQRNEFDRALAYYERIRSSEAGADSSLEKIIAETTVRKFEHALSQLDPNAPDYAERTAQIQAERDQFQLAECKSRVDRYPTDLQIRFEMGQIYFQTGKISEAIQEFQKAQGNPARRSQAMSYLGQCFARRGMNDMAARKFQEAIKEKVVLDDQKKELIYQLGCVLEKMGKTDEAIEQFKLIYEVDIAYKDVSEKVDKYYSSGG